MSCSKNADRIISCRLNRELNLPKESNSNSSKLIIELVMRKALQSSCAPTLSAQSGWPGGSWPATVSPRKAEPLRWADSRAHIRLQERCDHIPAPLNSYSDSIPLR